MSKKIYLLDGATGTTLWENTGLQNPVWEFNITHPQVVVNAARAFVDAGTEILLSNTFAANGPAVARSQFTVEDVVRGGVRLAKQAADGRAKVMLDVGPLTAMMEPYGDMTEEEVEDIYAQQIGAGMMEQPDGIWLETFLDLNMLEVAVQVAKRYDVPVYVTMAFESNGKTIFGNAIEDMVETLEPYGLAGIGLNCNITPDVAAPLMERFRACTELPLIFKPNAGTPVLDDQGVAHSGMSAQQFVRDALPAKEYASFMGGCCGTPPAFIAALKQEL